MKKITRIATDYPKAILAIVFAITVFFIFGATKLEIRNNQEAELPQDDKIVKGIHTIDDVFGERTMALIALETEDIYNPKTLQKVKDISKDLESVDYVIKDEVNSITTVNSVKRNGDEIDVGPFLMEIPESKASLELLKQEVLKNEMIRDQLVSTDGSLVVIAASVKDGYDQATLYEDIHQIVDKYAGPEKVYVTGEPIWLQDIEMGIKKDSDTIIPIAILIVLFGIWFSFRRVRAALLPLLAVMLTIVWTMGLMGYLGLPMTAISNALPVLMIAVGSSYGIHIMYAYYEYSGKTELKDEGSAEIVQRAIRKVGFPIVFTGLTTALSTLSLIVFKVNSLKEFGFIGAAGIFFATILTVTVIPALLTLLKKQETPENVNLWLENGILRLTKFSLNKNRAVLSFYFVLLLVSLFGISQIIVGDDFLKFFPEDHKGRIASNVFNDKLSGVRVMDIMIDSKEVDGIKNPEFFNKVKGLQEYLEQDAGIGKTFSYVDFVDEMEEVMNEEVNPTPLSREAIAQYLLLYSMSADPGDFNSIVDDDYQKIKIQAMLKTSEPGDHKKIVSNVENYFASNFQESNSVYYGGDVMLWIAQVDYVVQGKIINVICSVLVTLLLCFLVFRSMSASLFSIIPVVFSMINIFGIMGLLGIRLEITTAMLTAISVGIGIDFGIHYLSRVRAEKGTGLVRSVIGTASSTGKAISFDALSNMIGFSICVFSGFVPVRTFGLLLAISMGVICFNTLFMLPTLLKVLRPAYFTNKEASPVLEERLSKRKLVQSN